MNHSGIVSTCWLVKDRYNDERGTLDELVIIYRDTKGLYKFIKLPAQSDPFYPTQSSLPYINYVNPWGGKSFLYRVNNFATDKRIEIRPTLAIRDEDIYTEFVWGGSVKLLRELGATEKPPWETYVETKNKKLIEAGRIHERA